jgi:uncharacterized RDD family membrane protein YckC
MSQTAPTALAGPGTLCAHCHRPLRPEARFCTACGQPVAPDAAVTVVEGAQPRSREARPARRDPRPGVLPPSFGAATPATPGRRVLAYLLDALTVGLVAGVVAVVSGSVLYTALAVVELGLGLLVWELRTGRTLGNTLLGLRTAREETPYAVGAARGLLRGLVLAAGHAVAGLGQWAVVGSTALDRSGRAQGWHDRGGRAVVVDVRAHERAIDEAEEAAAAGAGAVAASAVAVAPTARPAAPSRPGVGQPGGGAVAPLAGTSAVAVAGASSGAGPVVPTQHPAAVAPITPVAVTPVVPARAPVEPEQPVVARQQTVAPYLVTLDTGQSMTVTGPGLIGRAPRPVPGERCDHVIVIEDPERSVSRSHARFGIDDGTFWVSDAGSGNGTQLALPGGRVVAVPADQRVPVPSGGVIRVGDRTVTIHAPGAYPRG